MESERGRCRIIHCQECGYDRIQNRRQIISKRKYRKLEFFRQALIHLGVAIILFEGGLSLDPDRLAKVGARAFLIGESLMRQDDVTAATRDILADPVST